MRRLLRNVGCSFRRMAIWLCGISYGGTLGSIWSPLLSPSLMLPLMRLLFLWVWRKYPYRFLSMSSLLGCIWVRVDGARCQRSWMEMWIKICMFWALSLIRRSQILVMLWSPLCSKTYKGSKVLNGSRYCVVNVGDNPSRALCWFSTTRRSRMSRYSHVIGARLGSVVGVGRTTSGPAHPYRHFGRKRRRVLRKCSS